MYEYVDATQVAEEFGVMQPCLTVSLLISSFAVSSSATFKAFAHVPFSSSGRSQKPAGVSHSEMSSGSNVIILPGNGCVPVLGCNWYAWLQKAVKSELGIPCALKDMPDPMKARESIWLPFIRNELGANDDSIIVGHSSGAEAAMRYAENNKVRGLVLVAACHTDLGLESEAISGYYSRPWEWARIRSNCGFISQFADTDDPFIPFEEARVVHEGCGSELVTATRGDHFMTSAFPELLEHLKARLAT